MEIFYTKFEDILDHKKLNTYLNCLPSSMREDILRYKMPFDLQGRLFGKLLLKKIFAHYFNNRDILYQLEYNKYGRPYTSNSKINFSISHSGKYVAVAIANGFQIGIDVEEIKEISIADFRSIFTEFEWNAILTSTNPLKTFYVYWTKKESTAKADGRGLSIPLNEIFIEDVISILYKKRWYLSEINLGPDYIMHIASEQKELINIHYITF
ncbi:4'-phosphopantetheinyl transferase family protein [Sporocytophaga myxococcoides]|uniref:4'-phosphopantetheinyl transferase family protein n=1 Tax=Sporocytophaga myxococcoides TaxID=153721 RepID=UPI0004902D8B|nr:4'-phosphopantetheinyl transferase superfamily protein [Sporocytophaga myxococcoides]